MTAPGPASGFQGFIAPVRQNLRRIADFSGRTGRREFWHYAAFAVAMSASAFVPFFALASAQLFADPDLSDLTRLMALAALTMATVAIVLLAAAVTRRLHDTGNRGFAGLLPVAPLAAVIVLQWRLGAEIAAAPSDQPPFGFFAAIGGFTLLYFMALGGLVLMLIRPGDAGSNRFGDRPD